MNSYRSKVLVLMATFNGEKYIEEQIISIIDQSACDVSILISDDDSDDKTINLINKIKNKYKIKIEVIKNKHRNLTPSSNFYNLFINSKIENFDYIALSDQDDIFLRNKFSESIRMIIEENVSAVSTSVQCFGHSKNILNQSGRLTKFDFLCEGAGQGCTFILSANEFLKFQKFCKLNTALVSNFYYHDWLIYLFFRANKFDWFFSKQCLTKYRIHKNNNTGSKYTFLGFFFRFKKIISGWYLKQIIIAINIYNLLKKDCIIRINFISLFNIIVFHGRRKFSDRIFSIFSLLSYPFIRK